MNGVIDEDFYNKNLFEKAKVGCGYFPWYYEDKKYNVIIAPWTDSGDIFITVMNNETKETITLEKNKSGGTKFTKEELHKLILFMNVPDEFDYN